MGKKIVDMISFLFLFILLIESIFVIFSILSGFVYISNSYVYGFKSDSYFLPIICLIIVYYENLLLREHIDKRILILIINAILIFILLIMYYPTDIIF